MIANTENGAIFSECRRYRYLLWRRWDFTGEKKLAMVIGLNPSTATETLNDPTVTRCINYAKDWGYAGLWMTNIFSFRATDPRVMKAEPEPVGMDNDDWLIKTANEAGIVLAAWGVHGAHLNRGNKVAAMMGDKLYALGVTKDKHPKHPLYLKRSAKPVKY